MVFLSVHAFATVILCAAAIVPGFFIAVLPGAASAQHVLLWGVTRGCELNKEASRLVKDTLESLRHSQRRRLRALSRSVADRSQVTAARGYRAHRDCLGGMVKESPGPQRFRLWLHDLASGQTAYLDDLVQAAANSVS